MIRPREAHRYARNWFSARLTNGDAEGSLASMRKTRTNMARFHPTEDEWAEWYRLSPLRRWKESQKLWAFFLEAGGSLDPEPDSQSPFDAAFAPRALSAHGRPGVRLLRRGGV